jgi:hypothetical protein
MLLISEEEKTNARKLSLVLCYVQRVTAAPVTVTYNDRGGKEKKKESYGRYQMKTILIINVLN